MPLSVFRDDRVKILAGCVVRLAVCLLVSVCASLSSVSAFPENCSVLALTIGLPTAVRPRAVVFCGANARFTLPFEIAVSGLSACIISATVLVSVVYLEKRSSRPVLHSLSRLL